MFSLPRVLPALLAAVFVAALAGCAPRLAPLYRDFEVATNARSVEARVEAALAEAGWTLRAPEIPNLLATEERTMSEWGLYRVRVSLEVARVGDAHVRVFVQPFRHYITGGRSKIPFLNRRLQAQALSNVTKALQKQGIVVVGTPFEADDVAVTQ